jgi:hypothetical protein
MRCNHNRVPEVDGGEGGTLRQVLRFQALGGKILTLLRFLVLCLVLFLVLGVKSPFFEAF